MHPWFTLTSFCLAMFNLVISISGDVLRVNKYFIDMCTIKMKNVNGLWRVGFVVFYRGSASVQDSFPMESTHKTNSSDLIHWREIWPEKLLKVQYVRILV